MRTRTIAMATAAMLSLGGAALAQSSPSSQGSSPAARQSAPEATGGVMGGGAGSVVTPNTGAANGEQTLKNNSATRALDKAAGTNVSGAFPRQSDGSPQNPTGTAAGRALDRAAGTNTSGAYPQNEGNTTTPPSGPPAGRAP